MICGVDVPGQLPKSMVKLKGGDRLAEAARGIPDDDFTHFVFQSLHTAIRDLQTYRLVPRDAIPQKLTLPRSRDGALVPIDLKLQFFLQIVGDRSHRVLSCHFAFDVNIAVIGVAAKPVSPALQFAIQVGQQNV